MSTTVQAIQDAQIIWQKPIKSIVSICSMSAGEHWTLNANGDGSAHVNIFIRDMGTGDSVYSYHFDSPGGQSIKTIVFGKDSTTILLVAEGTPSMIYTLLTSTGVVLDSLSIPINTYGIPSALPFADKVRWIISGFYGLFIFNTKTKTTDTVNMMTNYNDSIGSYGGARWIGLSDDETQIYTYGKGKGVADSPYRLCAWDVATKRLIYKKEDGNTFNWEPMSHPQSCYIAFVRSETTSPVQPQGYLYDLRTGTEVRSLPNIGKSGFYKMSLTKDGKYLAYQTQDGTSMPVRFMDTETGKVFAQYQTKYSVGIIQFISGSTTDVYMPTSDSSSCRIRLDPATSAPPDITSTQLQCTVIPNPAEGATVIRITLAVSSVVTLRLVTTDGRIVQDSSIGMLEAGVHSAPLRSSAGLYQCTVTAGPERSSFPIIIR